MVGNIAQQWWKMLFLPRLDMPNFDDSPREALPASEDSEESMGCNGMGCDGM